MLTGYNHNVMYKGVIYHVQTEDSGRDNPQITTLLYREGVILASRKTGYADILTTEHLNRVVEEIMQEQHKDMLRNLKNGVYDDRIERFSAPAADAAGNPAAQERTSTT